jgi:hypothetical protein
VNKKVLISTIVHPRGVQTPFTEDLRKRTVVSNSPPTRANSHI